MYKYLLGFFIFSTIISCSSTGYVTLGGAKKGLGLEYAKNISTERFFNLRMLNELERSQGKDWDIVYEDDQNVYLGNISSLDGDWVLNPFYKTSRPKLALKFPGYANTSGKHIKAKVFHQFIKPIIEDNLDNVCPEKYEIDYDKRDYELTEKGIEANIVFTGKCYAEKVLKAKITAVLSAKDLSVIEQNIDINQL